MFENITLPITDYYVLSKTSSLSSLNIDNYNIYSWLKWGSVVDNDFLGSLRKIKYLSGETEFGHPMSNDQKKYNTVAILGEHNKYKWILVT